MKKLLALLLILSVGFSCIGLPLTATAESNKISQELQGKLSELPDNEKIRVEISLNCDIDEDEVWAMALKEAGVEYGFDSADSNKVLEAQRRIYYSLQKEATQSFIDDMDIHNDVVYSVCLFVVAELTKEQINRAAAFDCVDSICTDISLDEYPTEEPMESPETSCLFKEKLLEYLRDLGVEEYLADYQELYYHYDINGNIDWAYIKAVSSYYDNIETVGVTGHRVYVVDAFEGASVPFYNGYTVYDVKNNAFYNAYSVNDYHLSDTDLVGFYEFYDEYGEGRLLGDIDNDDEISVLDVTLLLRIQANMMDYPADDEVYPIEDDLPELGWQKYYSDFNQDGERDMLDATCILRFLVGMTYPIG